jgi:hypothetical protein
MDRLTDSEKLIYSIMGAIADGNVPFVDRKSVV